MDLSLVVPTYNEKENLPLLLEKIFFELKKSKIKGEVIVVDDNSKDGTGDLVEKLKRKYKNLHVIHRAGKLGLSSRSFRRLENCERKNIRCYGC